MGIFATILYCTSPLSRGCSEGLDAFSKHSSTAVHITLLVLPLGYYSINSLHGWDGIIIILHDYIVCMYGHHIPGIAEYGSTG